MRLSQYGATLDMYRKVPSDLLEGTKRGSFLSFFATSVMVTLFLLETRAFLRTETVTDLALDENIEKRIRINFNITMMDLACEYATVDVVSVLGTEQNVSQTVTKFGMDAEGVRQRFHGRSKKQHDVIQFDKGIDLSIEELHEDGEDAVSLDKKTLPIALSQHQFVFVDFFASWCSHCRNLAPTWETLAEVMDAAAEHAIQKNHRYNDEEYEKAVHLERPVLIAKVDCVLHGDLCVEQNIRGYPTLRLFVDGEPHGGGDYRGDRLVIVLTDYLAAVEEEVKKTKGGKLAVADSLAKSVHTLEDGESVTGPLKNHRRKAQAWKDEEHPGCQLSGFLMVDRVPGNFHIFAASNSQDLVPSMTNVSHEVHHLSFGEPYVRRLLENGGVPSFVPSTLQDRLVPMDGNVYVNKDLHEAYHHYLKITTSDFSLKGRIRRVYQLLLQSQLSFYNEDYAPEAKFQYDLSPIAVYYSEKSMKWYDYMTSIMAIIGGTFTVVGMMESSIQAVSSKKRF